MKTKKEMLIDLIIRNLECIEQVKGFILAIEKGNGEILLIKDGRDLVKLENYTSC